MNRYVLHLSLVTALTACAADAESHPDGETTSTAVAAQPIRAVPRLPVRAIQAGTVLTFEVGENVSTSSHASGDSFPLVLLHAATGPSGASLAPGTRAEGLVTDALTSAGPGHLALLSLSVASVEAGGKTRPIEAQVQSAAIRSAAGPETAGGVVGTAIGIGVALTNRGADATLPRGSQIVIRLGRDLVF